MNQYEIVVVSHTDIDTRDIESCLSQINSYSFVIHDLTNSAKIEKEIERIRPDILVTDSARFSADEIHFLRCIQNNDLFIPVIFLLGNENSSSISHPLRQAADDSIRVSQISPESLKRSIEYVVQKSQDQYRRHLKTLELEIVDETNLDFCTGLHNRTALKKRLEKESITPSKDSNNFRNFIYFSINGLQRVNVEGGYRTGDNLLKRLGSSLATVTGEDDFVARLGGDEFCVLTQNDIGPISKDFTTKIKTEIRHSINVWLKKYEFDISVSISVRSTVFLPGVTEPDTLVTKVRKSMEVIKKDTSSVV